MEEHEVTRDDVGFEFMLNALRLADGVPASLFAERTGFPLAIVQRGLGDAVRRGLLEADPASIRPTELGRRFLNDLQALFLSGGDDRGGQADARMPESAAAGPFGEQRPDGTVPLLRRER